MITVQFKVITLQPDKRQYKTASPTLEPIIDLVVAVEIPEKNEYIYNLSNMTLALTSGNKQPDPILTPLGLAYVEDQLLARIDVVDDNDDDFELEFEDGEEE